MASKDAQDGASEDLQTTAADTHPESEPNLDSNSLIELRQESGEDWLASVKAGLEAITDPAEHQHVLYGDYIGRGGYQTDGGGLTMHEFVALWPTGEIQTAAAGPTESFKKAVYSAEREKSAKLIAEQIKAGYGASWESRIRGGGE